jgi:radical SAM PhpK family P-methyltransferase
MIDCLILGFYDSNLDDYLEMVKSMGADSGAFKDLDLALIELGGKKYRSMDVLNHFYAQGRTEAHKAFHNADFLWPVITYLGTYLSKRGLTFDYVNLPHLEKEKLIGLLRGGNILSVAITTTLYVSPEPILELVKLIREHDDAVTVIVGGPYITSQVKSSDDSLNRLFRYLGADVYVTCQEGELALVNVIKALKSGGCFNDIENIAYRQGEDYTFTNRSIESNPLEENLVDYTLFSSREINQFISTRTAKSCPFSCAFCGFPARAGAYKYLGVELVERELNAISDVGTVTSVTFIDDTFNVPKTRFKDILRMMILNNYGFKWNCFYRSDHGDDETIELMAKAGCEGVFLGVESGSDTMLKFMNKTARRADYSRAISKLRSVGISTYASIIIGFPGETDETVLQTIDFIEKARPDFYRAQLWYCDPITPIWEKRDELKIKGAAFNWSHYSMNSATACNWIDRIFLSIENSVWLPQMGFEQWSTFYLQRKGMTLGQIKTFIKCFNAAKKHELLFPGGRKGADLLESLRVSCQFDRPARPDMGPVSALSGSRFTAAERFWMEKFSVSSDGMSLDALATNSPGATGFANEPCLIDERTRIYLRGKSASDSAEYLLAVFGLLLSRLSGRDDVEVIVALREQTEWKVAPVKLRRAGFDRFSQFLRQSRNELRQSMEHRLFAFHALGSMGRMKNRGDVVASFDAVCIFGSSIEDSAAVEIREILRSHPDVAEGIKMALRMKDGDHSCLEFAYSKSHLKPQTVAQVAAHFAKTLREVADDEGMSLEKIADQGQEIDDDLTVSVDARESFAF